MLCEFVLQKFYGKYLNLQLIK